MADPTTPPTTGQKITDASAAAAGLALGRIFANQGASANIPPQLLQLLDQSVARQNAQNPLFGAMNSGAYQMLPTFARNGAGAFTPQPSSASGYGSAPNSSGPGTGTALTLAALPAILGILKHFIPGLGGAAATDANTFVGPKLPGGATDANSFVGPTLAGAAGMANAGGPTMGPGSNDYGILSDLNAAGIGGMFTGAAGGGLGNAGDQTYYGGNPIRGPKAF